MSCDNMKPYACGGSMNPNTVQNPCDRSLHFEGADDVTINQGVGIDLTEGVHAYDAHGNEIEYTVEPESIEKCEVGDHVITYTATGEGSRSVPTMCGETALYARACNIITEIKKRIITILQSANPIIRGLSDVLIQPDETFAPLSGVTSEDANGNELTVSYSGRYTNTAEGDIATFDTPYAEPMVSLVADIDPIQDLHGYDRPWVGGGGANKINPTLPLTISSQTTIAYYDTDEKGLWSSAITATNNTSIIGRLNISFSKNGSLVAQRYSEIPVGATDSLITVTHDASNIDFDRINVFVSGASSGYSITVKQAQLSKGTAPTNITPYSNICPISGWDSVDVSVCGINVWDEEWEVGIYNVNTGEKYANNNAIRTKNRIAVQPNTTYYAKTPNQIYKFFYDSNGDYISGGGSSSQNATFTTPSNAYFMNFYLASGYGTTYKNDISINYPSTDTEYHAYQGQTYQTTLPQTVYGGTLDVVSGVLTVDRAMVDLGSLNWGYSGGFFRATNLTNFKKPSSNSAVVDAISSAYSAMSWNAIQRTSNGAFAVSAGSDNPIFCNTEYSDATAFKTAMNGVQLVYELATPTTIQLTPTQIDSLLGRNNVWSDSGDVTVWYVDEIPQSAFSYPVRGKYIITYTAEDECGNRTEKDRTIQVGEETFRTVIYEDKTLIINERSSDIEENERLHGRAEYVYDAMDNDHPYVFSSPEDVPWNYVAGYPERVEFGSEVHPTSTAYWFYHMNQVNTFDFTNLDTSNVTDMKYMFYGCEHILNLAPELDTSNVTDMSHMFERCIATPEIDVSSFDTSNVTDMSSMFASCYNLLVIYAKPIFVTDNVISSNLMFGYDVHLVGGMGTPYDSNYEDKTYARIDDLPQTKGYFTDKDHITEWFRTAIHYDGTLIINESSLDQATNRELHGDAVAVYPPLDADHDYVFYTTSGGGSPYDVYWYQNRNNIKSVKIGSPIKPTNTAFWFNACVKITEMDFTNMDTSDVTEMGWMFFGCSKLNEIEFGDSFDTGNVFNFVGMFQACSELESVDLSEFDASSATLMGSMFNSDSSLKTIYASDAFVTDNVTSSSDMFSGCTSLVGGSGTVYDQNKTDVEYARIDNPPDEPGYFTSK